MLVRHSRILAVLALLFVGSEAVAQGPVLSGAGPVNRSMGGASTAAKTPPIRRPSAGFQVPIGLDRETGRHLLPSVAPHRG